MADKSMTPSQNFRLLQWVRLIAIALLVLTVAFRFAQLNLKVYWHDEVYTSMVITARPGKYLSEDLFQTKVVKPADLLAYQHFVPNLTLKDMVVRKGMEDVQHPPLYYVLLRFWAQIWGTDPAVIRGFSSLLSLLIFPALYWLCLQLFESPLSGWVAIALFAVSPLHLVYGQEAREFGFWTALILGSSGLLLQAIRFPSWRNWAWYGISMVIAFYTALFSLWIAVGHFAYVLWVDVDNRFLKLPLRIGKRTIFCLVTLLFVALLFIPWIYFMVASKDALSTSTSWTSMPLPLLITLQATVFNFSRNFIDFNFDLSNSFAYVLAIPVLILQAYAVYVLCRTAPPRVWGFILTFVGITALILGLPDVLFGGQRFTVTRYLIPCFVGLQLAVVYLLSTYLTATQRWKTQFAKLVFSLLILLGILSCGVYSQSNTWWNKVLNSNYHQVADLINGSDRPLVIVDAYSYNAGSMVSLSYLLKPDTQFLLLPPVGNSFPVQDLPTGVQTIFLFNLPESFRQQFESRYQKKLTPAFQDPWNDIWRDNASSNSDQKSNILH
ncbi:MAG TPA: glycosyltransferase family 39 protein [Coleofasciculaceae cyanobacterium]